MSPKLRKTQADARDPAEIDQSFQQVFKQKNHKHPGQITVTFSNSQDSGIGGLPGNVVLWYPYLALLVGSLKSGGSACPPFMSHFANQYVSYPGRSGEVLGT